MGEVLLKYRVAPDENTQADALEGAIRKTLPAGIVRISKAEVQPFVFGMKVLMLSLIVQDDEGNNDKVEEALGSTPGVSGAELLDMGRLM